jgi:hypothetical protein
MGGTTSTQFGRSCAKPFSMAFKTRRSWTSVPPPPARDDGKRLRKMVAIERESSRLREREKEKEYQALFSNYEQRLADVESLVERYRRVLAERDATITALRREVEDLRASGVSEMSRLRDALLKSENARIAVESVWFTCRGLTLLANPNTVSAAKCEGESGSRGFQAKNEFIGVLIHLGDFGRGGGGTRWHRSSWGRVVRNQRGVDSRVCSRAGEAEDCWTCWDGH